MTKKLLKELPESLRKIGDFYNRDTGLSGLTVMHFAADRIEQLETALREIADNSGSCYYDVDPHVCLRSKRAILALKGDKK